MDIQSYELQAGVRTPIMMPGRFFMLVETGGPVDVDFVANAGKSPESGRNVEAGYASMPGNWLDERDNYFDGFVLESDTNQTVRVAVSFSSGDYRRVVGIVQLQQPNDGDTEADQAVTAADAEIAAANTSARFTYVQNTGAANIRVRYGGSAATAARGIQLAPGQSVMFRGTAAIHAIREGGSDSTVSVTRETRT